MNIGSAAHISPQTSHLRFLFQTSCHFQIPNLTYEPLPMPKSLPSKPNSVPVHQ